MHTTIHVSLFVQYIVLVLVIIGLNKSFRTMDTIYKSYNNVCVTIQTNKCNDTHATIPPKLCLIHIYYKMAHMITMTNAMFFSS